MQIPLIGQTNRRTLQITLTLTAGLFIMAAVLRSQMPAVGPVWEFASVTTAMGPGTSICYASVNGCKFEKEQGGSENMMSSAAKLGEKGWELVAVSDPPSDVRRERVLYFKRLRSVINRSESQGNR